MDLELIFQGVFTSVAASIVNSLITISTIVFSVITFVFKAIYPVACGIGGICVNVACGGFPPLGTLIVWCYPVALAVPETLCIGANAIVTLMGQIGGLIFSAVSFPLSVPRIGLLLSTGITTLFDYLVLELAVLRQTLGALVVRSIFFCPIVPMVWCPIPPLHYFCYLCTLGPVEFLSYGIPLIIGVVVVGIMSTIRIVTAGIYSAYSILVDPICACVNGALFPIDYKTYFGAVSRTITNASSGFSSEADRFSPSAFASARYM